MEVKCIVVGSLEENCYILKRRKSAVVIDPGAEYEKILSEIKKSDAKLEMILLTHGHFDHIGAVSELAKESGAPVYVHEKDSIMLTDNSKNLSIMTGDIVKPHTPEKLLSGGEELKFEDLKIKVHYTPGHSDGCVCYECGDNLFGGDLLFKGSIGKFDRQNLRTHMNSLKYVMDNFDDGVKVYPGHGPFTTIGEERRTNPYLINHI